MARRVKKVYLAFLELQVPRVTVVVMAPLDQLVEWERMETGDPLVALDGLDQLVPRVVLSLMFVSLVRLG